MNIIVITARLLSSPHHCGTPRFAEGCGAHKGFARTLQAIGLWALSVCTSLSAEAQPPAPAVKAGALSGGTQVIGRVKDPQGLPLAGARITEYQTDRTYITDAQGGFTSAFPVSNSRRRFTAVHKEQALAGYGFLAPGEWEAIIKMEPAHILSGSVQDASGQPVAGAQVAPLSITSFYVLTDSQGHFDLGWDLGKHRRFDNMFLLVRQPLRQLAAGLDVRTEEETIVIQAIPGLTLTGLVEDPDGKPIPAAKVSLTLMRDGEMNTPIEPVITDSRGHYSFGGLPHQQEYKLTASAPGYGPGTSTTGRINTVDPLASVEPIVLKPRDSSISGRVIDVDGRPVEGVSVGVSGKGQPEDSTRTDAQGRFTLTQTCSGSFDVHADKIIEGPKREHLTGYVLNVPADTRDLEIVVFSWPYPPTEREESPFEADDRVGVLKYRWSGARGWRLLEGKGFQLIRMGAERPRGVRTKPSANDPILFGQWRSPAVNGGFRWAALMRSHPHGHYDQLFIDTDGDGHLDDESVVTAFTASQPSPTNTLTAFGPVKLLLDNNPPAAVHLSFSFYHSTKELCAGTVGWFEGDVEIGGVKRRCLLADNNADGTFDSQSANPSASDLIGFEGESNVTAHAVAPYLMLENRFYNLKFRRHGESMVASLTPAPQIGVGFVRVPQSITALRVLGDNGSFLLRPEQGKAKLPEGIYQLDYWLIERTDSAGTPWTLKADTVGAPRTFKILSGGTTELGIGEPVQARLKERAKVGATWNFREPNLLGPSGESVAISSGDRPTPLRLHIRNNRGDYDRSFTFEYG